MTKNSCHTQTLYVINRLFGFTIILMCSIKASAQQADSIKKTTQPITINTAAAPFITKQYTYTYYRPANELMYWPNYPQTPEAAQRRLQQQAIAQKPGNKLLKDIATGILKKKTPVAVQPVF